MTQFQILAWCKALLDLWRLLQISRQYWEYVKFVILSNISEILIYLTRNQKIFGVFLQVFWNSQFFLKHFPKVMKFFLEKIIKKIKIKLVNTWLKIIQLGIMLDAICWAFWTLPMCKRIIKSNLSKGIYQKKYILKL